MRERRGGGGGGGRRPAVGQRRSGGYYPAVWNERSEERSEVEVVVAVIQMERVMKGSEKCKGESRREPGASRFPPEPGEVGRASWRGDTGQAGCGQAGCDFASLSIPVSTIYSVHFLLIPNAGFYYSPQRDLDLDKPFRTNWMWTNCGAWLLWHQFGREIAAAKHWNGRNGAGWPTTVDSPLVTHAYASCFTYLIVAIQSDFM